MFEVEFEYVPSKTRRDNEAEIQAKIDAAIIAFLENVAEFAEQSFQRHVPVGDTLGIFEAIERGKVEKSPRGFSVSVGIGEVKSLPPGADPRYPLFVDEGTGLFGPEHALIFPEHGNVMAFTVSSNEWVFDVRKSGQQLFHSGPGQTVFTRFVEGQKAQHFSDIVDAETSAYFKVGKRELGKLLSKIVAGKI